MFKRALWLPAVITTHPPLPGSSAGKESACNAEDPGSIPGSGRSPGEENGYPLQYPGLKNSTDCIVHRGGKESHLFKSIQPSAYPFRERSTCVQATPREPRVPYSHHWDAVVWPALFIAWKSLSPPGAMWLSDLVYQWSQTPNLILENMLLYFFIREREEIKPFLHRKWHPLQ